MVKIQHLLRSTNPVIVEASRAEHQLVQTSTRKHEGVDRYEKASAMVSVCHITECSNGKLRVNLIFYTSWKEILKDLGQRSDVLIQCPYA